MLKEGDKFIRKSKYGTVRGIVKAIRYFKTFGKECDYESISIVSTNDIEYDIGECHKVLNELSPEQIASRQRFTDNVKRLQGLKELKQTNDK